MMEFVSWDDDIPNWMEKSSKPPTRYVYIYIYIHVYQEHYWTTRCSKIQRSRLFKVPRGRVEPASARALSRFYVYGGAAFESENFGFKHDNYIELGYKHKV